MAFNFGSSIHYAFFSVLLPLAFSLSFVIFIWGVFQYFIAGGHDEAAKEKSKALMLYGIILLVLMALAGWVGGWIVRTLAGA